MGLFSKKKKKNPKPAQAIFGNNELNGRILKELKVATGRYVDSVKRSNLFKSSAIYGNPWFMIIGPEGSGKTTILNGSEVNFPLKYPEDKDGDTASGIQWRFANEAVWIDIPGKQIKSENDNIFKAVYNGLVECRNERPVDGIVCVVSIEDILKGDHDSVKALAGSMRTKIDELISNWGIELPVYCVFSKTDKISGFYEFFNDSSVEWSDHLLGSTFSQDQQAASPRRIFQQEHELLCGSLKALRLKRLSKERKEVNRRAICRFVIEFEGLQAKAGDFFSELFKESQFEGKPVFRGFYFGSCKQFEVNSDTKDYTTPQPSDLSNTVLNHPLNPHRLAKTSTGPAPKDVAKKQIKSLFTKKLFNEVFPDGTQLMQKTQRFSRKELIKYWSINGLFAALFLLVGWYLVSVHTNIRKLYSQTETEMTAALTQPKSRVDAYEQLGRLGDLIDQYKKYNDKGVPLRYGIGFVKSKKIYESLKKAYFNRAWNFIVVPATTYLEYAIKNYNSGFEELSGDDYTELYRLLKSYLSMSEAVAQSRDKIDTLTIRETIEQALYQAILKSEDKSRLPENIEIILKKNIGLYCMYLKKGEIPFIQENQQLVKDARVRLSKLPDASVLYASMRERLIGTAPQLTLVDLLNGKTDIVLTSTSTVSSLYTQDGWDRYVEPEIEIVIKDPFKIDWVLGVSKEGIGDAFFDQKEMREDMIEEYYNDIYIRWMEFLGSVSVEPLGDIVRSGTVLQKLSAQGSELNVLLENVLSFSTIEIKSKEEEALNVGKKLAAKKLKKLEKKMQPVKGLIKTGNPKEALKTAFDPLRNFIRSEGRLGGLNAYRERMSVLAEALLRCAKQGNVITVFNGKDTDPLQASWAHSQSLIIEMPEAVGNAVTPLLQKPLEYTGAVMSSMISKELNQKWQNDVAAVFTNRFAGKYPFSHADDECSFDDVMEYFRPTTGTFWGYYTTTLAPYIYKDGPEWKTRQVGCVTILFTNELIESLKGADRITKAFFNADGTLTTQKMAFLPMPQNKLQGSLTIDGQEYKLLPDENRVRLQWPVTGQSEDVVLKIFVNPKYTEELKFGGKWGLLRLFESARINAMNSSSFVAKWERNVQNMFMIQYGCHVQIAGASHPFGEQVFTKFDCPLDIIKKQD